MVRVREPYELVVIKNGQEVKREEEIGEVFYCDDCNAVIVEERFDSQKRTCYLCEKDLCENHRYRYPSDDAPPEKYVSDKRFICDRCKTEFAKELEEYTNYLITLEKLQEGIDKFIKKFGEKRVGNWDQSLPIYHQRLAKQVRDDQQKKNANTARNRERKFKGK